MKSVSIVMPNSGGGGGINLGTISLRRNTCKYLCYITFLGCFALLASNSKNNLSVQFQYFELSPSAAAADSLGKRRALKELFRDRNELLEEVCHRYPSMSEADIDEPRFYFLKRPNFLMCMIPKVASTSFSGFLLTAHQSIIPRGMENLGYNGTFAQSVNKDTYKVMVVRHPMERLLSAFMYIFNDAVTDSTDVYANMSRLLLQNYREHPGPFDTLSFPEFVRYVVNRTVENLTGDWVPTEGQPGNFWIRDDLFNSHWLSYARICTPCRKETRPNAIIKMGSTMRDETDYVFQESGVFEYFEASGLSLKDLHIPWANPSKEGRADDLRKKYFSMLTKSNVRELYEKFRMDHELFGYSIEPYLSLAK